MIIFMKKVIIPSLIIHNISLLFFINRFRKYVVKEVSKVKYQNSWLNNLAGFHFFMEANYY